MAMTHEAVAVSRAGHVHSHVAHGVAAEAAHGEPALVGLEGSGVHQHGGVEAVEAGGGPEAVHFVSHTALGHATTCSAVLYSSTAMMAVSVSAQVL